MRFWGVILSAAGILTAFDASNASNKATIRVELQASMQRYIDRHTQSGLFPVLSFETGDIHDYTPTKAHSVIFRGEEFFVLCSEMKTPDGRSTPVDYYMIETSRGFKVFKTEVDNRKPLQKLMKMGKVWKY